MIRIKPLLALLVLLAAGTIWLDIRTVPAQAQGSTPEVIALDESFSETSFTLRFAFWFPITKNPTPQPGSAGSVWTASGTSAGATVAQNTAIQNGTILEEVRTFTFPVGTPVAAIEAVVQQAWIERNAQINGQGANQFYGDYFNGAAWAFQ